MTVKLYMLAMCLFVISSLFHVFRNSFFSNINPLRKQVLYFHYACLMLVIASAVGLILTHEIHFTDKLKADLVLVIMTVILIQSIRLGFDYWELSARHIKVDYVRHIADAAANFITIALILITITIENFYLTIVSMFLSVMIFGKEMKYRLYDDYVLRSQTNVMSTSQGGAGNPSQPLHSHVQAWIRYIKSLIYVNISFGLFGLCYSQFNTSLKIPIEEGVGALSPLLSAIFLTYVILPNTVLSNQSIVSLDWIIMLFCLAPYASTFLFSNAFSSSMPPFQRR